MIRGARGRSGGRPTWCLAAAVLLVATGCGPRSPASGGGAGARRSTGDSASGGEAARALVGQYDCRYAWGDVALPSSPCAITATPGAGLQLVQDRRSPRLTGTVVPDPAGFRIDGVLECAAPCPLAGDRPLRLSARDGEPVFFAQPAGAFAAVVPLPSGELINIDLVRRQLAPDQRSQVR